VADITYPWEVMPSTSNDDESTTGTVKISFEAVKAPLWAVIRDISQVHGVTIFLDADLQEREVTALVRQVSIDKVIDNIAKQLDVETKKEGSIYYIGNLADEDKTVYCSKFSGVEKQDIEEALKTIITDKGRLFVMPSGLVVVLDQGLA